VRAEGDCAVDAGKVFRILRSAQGKTTRQIGAKSGVDYTTYNRLENGLAPSPDQVRRLARAFRIREKNLQRTIALANEARD